MSSYLHYAPTCFDEIVLPPVLKSQLLEMRKRDRIENMLFHGRPGLGDLPGHFRTKLIWR